jgi:hypothetical protein
MSLVSFVCCQVDAPATFQSLAQKSPTECGVSECDLETSTMRRPRPVRATQQWGGGGIPGDINFIKFSTLTIEAFQ